LYVGDAASISAELVREGKLPSGASVAPALREIPLVIRVREGATVAVGGVLARTLQATWYGEGSAMTLRPDRDRQDQAFRDEVRLVARLAEAKIGEWPSRGFGANGGSVAEARRALLANLAAARQEGWKEAPSLALGNAVQALTQALGGDFLAGLRQDRPTYFGTIPSGITEPLPARGQPFVRTYLQVQRDPQVRSALSEAFHNARAWFGPSEVDPSETAESALFVFTRTPVGFYAQASAYAKNGTLVDRGSSAFVLDGPQIRELPLDLWKTWEKTPFDWSKTTTSFLAATNADLEGSDLGIDPKGIGARLHTDPLLDLAQEVARAVPWDAGTDCVVVVPADTWLFQASRLGREGATLAKLVATLGKIDGSRIRREERTITVDAALARHVERERCPRVALRRHLTQARTQGREDLRSYLSIEAGMGGRRGASYLAAIRQALRRSGVATLTVQSPFTVNRWLGALSAGEFEALLREELPVGRFSSPSALLQATLDAWAPFTLRGKGVSQLSDQSIRVCLWSDARVRREVTVRLETTQFSAYVRDGAASREDLAMEAEDFAKSIRVEFGSDGVVSPARLAETRAREVAVQSISLAMSLGDGAVVNVPIAERRTWQGKGAPISSFTALMRLLDAPPPQAGTPKPRIQARLGAQERLGPAR
jgi:hypothetical protein